MKEVTIRVTAIDFDTDGNKRLAKKLAKETIGKTFDIGVIDDDEDPMDFLADAVSDSTGWCVNWVSGEVV